MHIRVQYKRVEKCRAKVKKNDKFILTSEQEFDIVCSRKFFRKDVEYMKESKNEIILFEGKNIIAPETLVAITLFVAQSNPKEKEVVIDLLMNMLIGL